MVLLSSVSVSMFLSGRVSSMQSRAPATAVIASSRQARDAMVRGTMLRVRRRRRISSAHVLEPNPTLTLEQYCWEICFFPFFFVKNMEIRHCLVLANWVIVVRICVEKIYLTHNLQVASLLVSHKFTLFDRFAEGFLLQGSSRLRVKVFDQTIDRVGIV